MECREFWHTHIGMYVCMGVDVVHGEDTTLLQLVRAVGIGVREDEV